MNRDAVKSSYVQSLLWVELFWALAFAVDIVVELVLADFVHGNPNRTHGNALFMMVSLPLIAGIISIIGVVLVFTLPQCMQAVATYVLIPKFGRAAL